ncbi:cytidylyltransferase domain-containing protein [Olleya sp. HaHaR_3_96]|uniref:acylneuraminate cytidylyltransferase family protein n=1 Tax=Olleya sp. HaHaR_3_96 TaxID=2745560 RepID=UPI001C4EAD7F|nr:acylneuraminate cytidylyltransferase family protein [Olleya sp. HaHaR_3_96]QXP61688.1 acylneuraminate cytidylyltransferase family protein [Olleya sp. HaHaR_3_96]
MKILGIIPARGGSKGVSRKNVRLVDGQPLISYTIQKAKESKLLTDIFVSTDCDEIIEVANKYQCESLKRSRDNAKDTSKIEEAIIEVLKSLKTKYDLIVLLQPTAPIRESEDIDNVIQMFLEDTNLECVVSVIALEDIHPARMYHVNDNRIMSSLDEKSESKRRQDLKPVFLRNGAIYAVKTTAFLKEKKIILPSKKAYVMPESKWANVDTERDLLITEVLIKEWKKGVL